MALATTLACAQPFERLPVDVLDALAPSARIVGDPGHMTVENNACISLPREQSRRRIVDLAIQEWGYFGFTTVDETIEEFDNRRRRQPSEPRQRWVGLEENARVADSIAGYWAVTPDGAWILERQNGIWRRATGSVERWRDPWSAAFISWVMCEGGLADASEFKRAVAHYTYIDQAIEARDRSASEAAFVAYEVGESAVEPGDMLCRGRRGAYRDLAERRADLGVGARSHCDIVVKLDPDNDRIFAIGGNVRGSVRLKFLPATLAPGDLSDGVYTRIGRPGRLVFAHLKLQAPSLIVDAFATRPTNEVLSRDPAALRRLEQRLVNGGSAREILTWRSATSAQSALGAGVQPAG
jgi:hypothetical protein